MTKPDKNRQEQLSVVQETAIGLLLVGQSDGEVAAAVNRSRQTVNAWRAFHPLFRSELNRRRNELWEGASDHLRSLIPKALAVLAAALENENHAFKAAYTILKMANLPLSTIGPTEEQDIIVAAAEAKDKRNLADVLCTVSPADIRRELMARAQEDSDEE